MNKKQDVIVKLFELCEQRNDYSFHNEEVKHVCNEVGFGNPFDATKIDDKEKLPESLIEKDMTIIHLGHGEHQFIQGVNKVFHDFEDIQQIKTWKYKKSLLNMFNSSESNILSVANNQRILHDFLFDEDKEFCKSDIAERSKTYFPHRTGTSFKYNIGDESVEIRNIQIEIDLTIEFNGTVCVFEAKNGIPTPPSSFSVYQLYHPFLYYYKANEEEKIKIEQIYGVYVVRKFVAGINIISLWKYTFIDPYDMTSIQLEKSASYRLLPPENIQLSMI